MRVKKESVCDWFIQPLWSHQLLFHSYKHMMVLDICCSPNIIVTALLFLISIIFLPSLLPYNNEISASHHRVCHIHTHSLSLYHCKCFVLPICLYHLHFLLRIDGKLPFKWLCSCYHSLAFTSSSFVLSLYMSLSNSLCHSLVIPFMSQCCLRCYHNFLSLLHILTSVMNTRCNDMGKVCVQGHVFLSTIFIYHLCTVPMSILLMFALAVLSWILTSVMPSHTPFLLLPYHALNLHSLPNWWGAIIHSLPHIHAQCGCYHHFSITASTSSCLLFVISTHSQTHPFPYYYKFFLLLHILILS